MAGADINANDHKQRTPLWLAVDNNRVQVACLLCAAGALTSQAGPEGRTPLHVAASKGHTDCAETLLQHGASVDGNPDK